MNPLQAITALLAPHTCFVCNSEGSPLCVSCAKNSLTPADLICYRCGGCLPCPDCIVDSPLAQVFMAYIYAGAAKQLVGSLKFDRVKASAEVIADWLHRAHPKIKPGTIVSPIPTANSRIRRRGYDQASLIARCFAKKRNLKYQVLLRRLSSTRQVGSNRQARFKHLQGAFQATKSVKGLSILLIDDVLTTGATVESASRALIGAKEVNAAVFAYSLPKAKNSSSTRSDLR